MSAPRAAVRSRFSAGTSAGITMVAGMPRSRAAAATPCAWLPDEKATTPSPRASGGMRDMRLKAPRNLNDPVRWKISAFISTRLPVRRAGAVLATSGVRIATSVSTFAASSTSAAVGSGFAFMDRTVSGRRSRGNRGTILHLYHERHGRGRPLIALHGYGETLYTWRHLVDPVSAGYEVHLFDLKGHGRSPKPRDGKYTAEDQAELVHDFIRRQNLTGVTLMGHSMGGGIALLLAQRLLAERPDRLASLVLLSSVSYPQPIAALARVIAVPFLGEALLTVPRPALVVRAVLRGAYYDAEKITADDIEAYKANLADHDSIHAMVTIARHIVPREIEPALSAINASGVPVLLIWGCQDHYVPLSFGSRLNARLKHSRLWAIDKCGHVHHGERQETVAPAVAAFLARREMPV